MKKSTIILFVFGVLALFLGSNVIAQSQTPSTVGKDFYVMFLRNDKNFPMSNSNVYYPDKLQLIITGKNTCSGTITSTNGTFNKSFTVTSGEITTIDIPRNTSASSNPTKQAGYSYRSGFIEDKGLHVTSSDSISLYAVNYCDASLDITNVLPSHALGDEYIIQNYKGIYVNSKYRPASFVIVATEDSTTVDITPTTTTGVYTPGNSTQTTTYNAGQSFYVTLNAGQTYQLLAWSKDAFDGTYIKARDYKKIAVFQGCGISPVPNTTPYYGYESHLYEQSIPTKCWGKQFIVTQSLQRANDRVKVTALNNGCTVKINGTLMKTLAARETYEFEIVKDLASDTLQNIVIDKVYGAAHYIETSEPASVFLYMTSREYGSNTGTETIGDPSMVLVTPIEQQIDYVTFSTFETTRVKFHHVNIVTETDKKSNMTLDGSNIESAFNPVPGNPAYSYARLNLEQGTHTLQCSGGGFAAHVYGFGEGVGKDESYAYTVGGYRTLVDNNTCSIIVSANPNNAGTVTGSSSYNYGATATVKATPNEGYSFVNWTENNTEISNDTVYSFTVNSDRTLVANFCGTTTSEFEASSCESYTWNDSIYTESGDYIQIFDNYQHCDSIVTLHLTIGNYTNEFYKTACDYYAWNNHTYLYTGDYTETFESYQGCDSIVTMHLTINHAVSHSFNHTACEPFNWNGQYISTDGSYTHTLSAANGCDSIVTMNVTFQYPEDGEITKVVCGDSYDYYGVTYTQSGDYVLTFVTQLGCDSIVTMHLTLVPEFEPQISVEGTVTACGSNTATLTTENGYSEYLWSTGETTQSIQVTSPGSYWVMATDQNGCAGTSEMVQLGVSEIVSDAPSICMVGIQNNHNYIVWNGSDDPAVEGYKIYRENDQADVYDVIGSVQATDETVFEDTYSNPRVRAYRYKLSAFDACGAETQLSESEYHQAIHLVINQGIGGSWNLIWSPYIGAEVISYRIYRGRTNNTLELIQTMPSTLTSFTDLNETGDAAFYQIEAVLAESCGSGTKDFVSPLSNTVYNGENIYTEDYAEECDSYEWYGMAYTKSGNYFHESLIEQGVNKVETLHLTINKANSPVIGGNLSIIAGESITLTSSEAESYLWSTGETTQSISVSPTGNTTYSVTTTDTNGCTATTEVIVSVTDGIGELENSVRVFPNPTKNTVNIETEGIRNVRVTDMLGQTLFETNTSGNTVQIDMSGYAVGSYFLQVRTANGVMTKKVVKK